METIKQLLTDIFKNGEKKEEEDDNRVIVTITTATGKYTFARYPDETDEDVLNSLIKRGQKIQRLMETRFDTKSNPKTEPQPKRQAGQWFFFFTENETIQLKNVA